MVCHLNVLAILGYPLLSDEVEETEDAQRETTLLTKWQRVMGINYEIVVSWLTLLIFLFVPDKNHQTESGGLANI